MLAVLPSTLPSAAQEISLELSQKGRMLSLPGSLFGIGGIAQKIADAYTARQAALTDRADWSVRDRHGQAVIAAFRSP